MKGYKVKLFVVMAVFAIEKLVRAAGRLYLMLPYALYFRLARAQAEYLLAGSHVTEMESGIAYALRSIERLRQALGKDYESLAYKLHERSQAVAEYLETGRHPFLLLGRSPWFALAVEMFMAHAMRRELLARSERTKMPLFRAQ